jgi:spore coat polysaccharide biosynthesis predicted glycosyltransferase SpsG
LATGVFVAVIDDLADRRLDVQLVVNGSAGAAAMSYRAARHTRFLLGPRFIPLRAEFAEAPVRTTSEVRRLLVTVGGADPTGVTGRLLGSVARALPGAAIDVVIGPLTRRIPDIGSSPAVALHEDPKDMRALMLGADLAISGGGQTLYELAATATPAVGLRLADNQTLNLTNLQAEGTLLWAGDVSDDDVEARLASALTAVAGSRARREEMGRRGRALVDGGGAVRVAGAILDEAAA